MSAAARFLRSPYGAMTLVVAMYVGKVIAKIGVGSHVHSPMILGDGYHNVSDIFEALLVIGTIAFARRSPSGKYPFGRKNAESLLSFAIGVLLVAIAAKLAAEALFGLGGWLPGRLGDSIEEASPFHREALVMSGSLFWWVAGVTGGSALLSIVVSRYQISVGRERGHDSLIADGEETKSDGMIELAAFAGVCSEYLFHQPRLEYAFTLVVAWKMAGTGREIAKLGLAALLKRSLGAPVEDLVRAQALSTHGVASVADLKTFRVGGRAVIIVKLVSRCGMATNRLITAAVAAKFDEALKEDFDGVECFIRFAQPDPDWHRVAYAIVVGGESHVAERLTEATHLRIANVADGECFRWKDRPMPKTLAEIAALVKEKRVRAVYVLQKWQEEIDAVEAAGARLEKAASPHPRHLGL